MAASSMTSIVTPEKAANGVGRIAREGDDAEGFGLVDGVK